MVDAALQRYTIDLIDDDLDEAEFLQQAIAENNLPITLRHYKDFYHFSDTVSGGSLPDLLVIDINLPRKNGIEALHEIKTDVTLSAVPAVTFTTSTYTKYLEESKEAGAIQLIVKPTTSTGYKHVVDLLFNICRSYKMPSMSVAC
ncbi:response regulator [Aridibaculum aurantiacum]|uniref:response regulator n=1 Tax=Aridibaculum aurantiacum TaxID=2810307 RepID=UPI001A95F9F9|nr:response regulator [Aridibaculum aurantiacum]